MTTTSPHLCTPFARELARALKAQDLSKRQLCVRLGHQRAGWLSDLLRRLHGGTACCGEVRDLCDAATSDRAESKRLILLALGFKA